MTILLLAAIGQFNYEDAARNPAQPPAVQAAPAPAPPPLVVKFNEDAATKDDVKSLAASIAELRKELVALKAAPKPPAPPAAKVATKAAPPPTLWQLADDSRVLHKSYDPDELIARVARRNQELAAAPRYYSAPLSFGAACAGGSCGTPSGSFGMPMMGGSMGFGFGGGGCAGGSCR